jgi:hypothetical protein
MDRYVKTAHVVHRGCTIFTRSNGVICQKINVSNETRCLCRR